MAAWKGFDLREELGKIFDWPVLLDKDTTSACGAELTFGTAETPSDFLYIYNGYFVGGGIVLYGTVYSARAGNAGAIGPFPIKDQNGHLSQLVDTASIIGLERRFSAFRGDTAPFEFDQITSDTVEHEILNQWLDEATASLAQLIVGACSIIDFSFVLIDGNMPQ